MNHRTTELLREIAEGALPLKSLHD